MKQGTIDIFTSLLVIANHYLNLLHFVPVMLFDVNQLITLPLPPIFLAVILMVIGLFADIILQKSKFGFLTIGTIHFIAYALITPNLVLVALFTGVILFGQLFLKE